MTLFENKKLHFSDSKKTIKDYKSGEKIDVYLKIQGITKKTKKDGSPYLTLELMDKSGKVSAKIWENADHYFKNLQEGGIYKVSGFVGEYMNQKDIRIDVIRALGPRDTDFDETDFVEKPAFDTRETFDEMIDFMKSHLSNPFLLQLADLFATEHGDKFKNHYGAQKIHHSYIGGLLEHTYSIMKLAVLCSEHYKLDKELVLTGVLFHDIGKVYEFNVNPAVEVTIEGGLLGHLIIGNTKFLELKSRINGFPEDLSCKIQHLIISHHGEKEFGSPEVPKIPEAFLLHILDLLDSKLKIVEEALNNSEVKGLFSDYVQVLGRRLYVPPKG